MTLNSHGNPEDPAANAAGCAKSCAETPWTITAPEEWEFPPPPPVDPSIPRVHGSVHGPVPVGADVTEMASWVTRPQSISIVYGYDDGSPAIELTEGFPVGAS